MKYQTRPYQQSAVDNAVNWVKYMPEKHGIVWAATAAGKSIMIAKLAEAFPDKRILILAHRKELLEQNSSKIAESHSIYSSGLGENDLSERIVIAGIQSIARVREDKLPRFDLVLIDECHRVSNNSEDESQYWNLMAKLGNPQIIGFTATPYRLGGGFLSWGEIIYEITYPQLLALGFVTPLTNKVSGTPDLSNVRVKLGDYVESQLEEAMIDPEQLKAAVHALDCYGKERNSILIFAVSAKHCEILNATIIESGLAAGGCAYVTGETSDSERNRAIDSFRNGELRILINCMILIEGFDAPSVDAIFCLRPTKSKALWEQMLGRGVRLFDGKENCLVIDMAGNLKEHGSLAAPYHKKATNEKTPTEKGRICPECEEFNEGVNIKECACCGYQFPEPEGRAINHDTEADFETETIYSPLKRYKVDGVTYRKHVKAATGGESLRVDYVCQGAPYGSFSEWYAIKSESEWARNKGWMFFKERGVTIEGDIKNVEWSELLHLADTLKEPTYITVDTSEKYPRVKEYEWASPPVVEMPFIEELEDSIPW
jgi:DNA repair protein RadD